ncbi:MAG: hypothetical protein J2P41_04735 [Blastocatellia bacterium]|nr:hypothetical protein [Blastocatellia bacterium]
MKKHLMASLIPLILSGLIYHPTAATQSVRRQPVKKEDVRTVLNGIWTIESTPPKEFKEMARDFLPPGTRVQLKLEGPTRLAIEEERKDELGGEFTLLPPFIQGICATPLGEGNGYGSHVCEKGQIIDPNRPVSNDAEFSFYRWSKSTDLDDALNIFFADQGAKVGAQFVLITLRYKSVSWKLWVRDRDTLVGNYIATLASKDIDEQVQTWRRIKTP